MTLEEEHLRNNLLNQDVQRLERRVHELIIERNTLKKQLQKALLSTTQMNALRGVITSLEKSRNAYKI